MGRGPVDELQLGTVGERRLTVLEFGDTVHRLNACVGFKL
jgi:hypothetical protein